MKTTIAILCLLSLFTALYTIPITFSEREIDFGVVEIHQPQTATIWLKNASGEQQIVAISSIMQEFAVSDTLLHIAAADSMFLSVTFTGMTNIHYRSILVFTNQIHTTPAYIPVSAEAHLSDDIYSTTYDLYDTQLKTALFELVDDHSHISYDAARLQMFSNIENHAGIVECIYTGLLVETMVIPSASVMNTEHAWPQSMGASERPARTDLHHLFPTQSSANSIRSNLPYGVVQGTPTWESNGSKRGFNDQGMIVFEPRDETKGVVSRALLYFAVRYGNPFAPFFDYKEAVVKSWNRNFAVTERELNRNTKVAQIQDKRNPFIDHPAFADRIFSIATDTDRPPTNDLVYQAAIYYEHTGIFTIPLYNNGSESISISQVEIGVQDMILVEHTPLILSQEIGSVDINILSTLSETVTISLHTNIGVYQISLSQYIVNDTDDTLPPQNLFNFSVYPNPAKDVFKVKINRTETLSTDAHLSVYNIKGQQILTREIFLNETEIKMPDALSNGIYFIRIQNGEVSKTGKFLYMK